MNPQVRLAVLILISLLLPILPFVVIGELPGERWLSSTDDNAPLFGLIGAGLLIGDSLLPVPSSIVGTLLGARLGFLPGWLLGWVGLTLGNLVGYIFGRLLLSRFGTALPQVPGLLAVFASRPVPVLAEAVTFTAGAEHLPWRRFFLASLAGNGVYTLILAANGAALLPDGLLGPGLIIPMLLPVLAWLVWRRMTNPVKDKHADKSDRLSDGS